MSLRIGLFGGSFNPIHCGHLIVARCVAEKRGLQRVIFLPSARPPHKDDRELWDASHRAEMVQLAIAGEPLFDFSDYDLIRHGPCYTIDTVLHFRKEWDADTDLSWIIGADSLAELPSWNRIHELVDACRIVTAVRPGWEAIDWDALRKVFSEPQVTRLQAGLVETPQLEISSTDIRQRIREGHSIRYLVPESVREYVELNITPGPQ